MPRPVIYDITRLATRFTRPAPNGIDRVDIGYAKHFLRPGRGALAAMLGVSWHGGSPRAVDNLPARQVVEAIEGHWREHGGPGDDYVYDRLRRFLNNGDQSGAFALQTTALTPTHAARSRTTLRRYLRHSKVIGSAGLLPGRPIIDSVPANAVYFNASQFPLWMDWYFKWLDRRRDVKAVFFLHDLLPIHYPEFFPSAEAKRHHARLEVLASRAAGIIVATDYTRDALFQHLRAHGLRLPSVLVAPLPVSPTFLSKSAQSVLAPLQSPSAPYFVSIGTLEPRKNQLFLLQLWRDLVDELGPQTPRLILVGARGWDNENLLDMLDRCECLRPVVLEVTGLSTPALAEVMRGAAAVLMPTLAEGFGLPVAEACALGTPLIASDIPAFRLVDGPMVTKLDPLDGHAWRQAILRLNDGSPRTRSEVVRNTAEDCLWLQHIGHIEHFIDSL